MLSSSLFCNRNKRFQKICTDFRSLLTKQHTVKRVSKLIKSEGTSARPLYSAVGSPITKYVEFATMKMTPVAPSSGKMTTETSPSVEEMSALLSAETRDKVNLSSPSSMESGFVCSVIFLLDSPYFQKKEAEMENHTYHLAIKLTNMLLLLL